MIKYYSYDIFDTCLVRTCGRPNVVFDILAKEVLGDDAEFNLLADFAYERKEGENRARQKLCHKGIEDVSIDQIYQVCDFSPFTDKPNGYIKEIELRLEKEILRPVKSINEEIDYRRRLGAKIIFISDMYLGCDILTELLSKYGLYKDGDKIYVSCEAKVTKNSGNLYRFVAQKLGITNFKEWLHSGDNPHADVFIPKRLGIRTNLVRHNYSYYEKNVVCWDFSNQEFEAEKIASISRSVLCEFGMTSRNAFAADFVAPSYVPFVEYILANAKNRGIRKLFFFARDGFILYKIAQKLGNNYPDISLHYLYVSRDSLYVPSLPDDYSLDTIKHLFWNIDSFDAKFVIRKLHMSDYDCSNIPLKGKFGFDVIKTALEDAGFKSEFDRRRKEQKRLCYKYFEQEKLTEPHSAIVDLSGTRRCQMALNRILGKEHEVFGYYFVVFLHRDLDASYYSLNYEDRINDNAVNCNISPPMLLECYFSITNQNRTYSYMQKDGVVVPVFEEDSINCETRKTIYDINEKICLDYANKYMLIANRKKCRIHSGYGMAAYSRFLFAPDIYYTKALEGLQLSESKSMSIDVLKKDPAKNEYEGSLWRLNKVYNSFFPQLMTFIFRIKFLLYPQVSGLKYERLYPFLIVKFVRKLGTIFVKNNKS